MMKAYRSAWVSVILAVLLVLTGVPAVAGSVSYGASRDVEWGCYQNSSENNGVVDGIAMPDNYKETSLKWARKMVDGYTTSFTPPLIIDGYLYVASNKHVMKINKETGEIADQSLELKINVSYAMNPITYDEEHDLLFVPLMHGQVQCLDAGTLESKWVSEERRGFQSLSPIVCRDGHVYYGIWESEVDDGSFFSLNMEDGSIQWEFIPSESGDAPRGFYWAGAYVTDKYIAVGSDNGTSDADGTGIFYSLDPNKKGAVIDRITGIPGDIRSTTACHDGYLYFTSGGGWLCKVRINADGTFDHDSFSHCTLGYMRSTPVIHNGRIYVGVAGTGEQFSADGGHMIAVVRDDQKLTDGSKIYSKRVSGFPTAAGILSTYDEDSKGIVRFYFTFNAPPGGIYCLEEQTGASTGTLFKLYDPERDMQQYCISPLCCDREGTIYFKNDSGYLMAVSRNEAYLNEIHVLEGDDEVQWDSPFDSGRLNYTLRAGNGVSQVRVRLDVPEGMTAFVGGESYNGNNTVTVSEEMNTVKVTVKKTTGGTSYQREYVLNISSANDNPALKSLALSDSNTAGSSILGYDPAFDPENLDYVSKVYTKDSTFGIINLWPVAAEADATIRVIPVSDVGNPQSQLEDDGSVVRKGSRYPLYWIKGQISMVVDVEVTAPSGISKRVYSVTVQRKNTDIGVEPVILTVNGVQQNTLAMTTTGSSSTASIRAMLNGADITDECSWESTDAGVATVDEHGNVAAGLEGSAVIWATYPNGNQRVYMRIDVSRPVASAPEASIQEGTYQTPLNLRLSSSSSGTQIRYNMAEDGEEITAPETTTGTVYDGGISLPGVQGEKKTYRIWAIACGGAYSKSKVAKFAYVVDLREDAPEGENTVDPNGEILLDTEVPGPFANGTSMDEIHAAVKGIHALVPILGAAEPLTCDIVWDTENNSYDPENADASEFVLTGNVVLPEGYTGGGSNLKVRATIRVAQGTVEAPAVSLPEGTYGEDQLVALSTGTKGASIMYTVTGGEGTMTYSDPIPITGVKGEKTTVLIKAYAIKNKVTSKTVTFTYVIDKTTAPATAPVIQSAAVNASKKTISLKFKEVKGADAYQVEFRKAGAAKWTVKKIDVNSCTIKGLGAKELYEIRVSAVNDKGSSKYSTVQYRYIVSTTVKLTKKKKSFKAKIKKVSGATGYTIQYSLKKNMAGASAKQTKKTTYTVKKLQKKKTYYVTCTPYKTYKGKQYTGQTSAVKSVKVK